METRGTCEIIDGNPAVRDERGDSCYFLRPYDRFIGFFPNSLSYCDITYVPTEGQTQAFGHLLREGPPEGFTQEEWIIPFLKNWYGVIVFGTKGPWS